MKERHEDKDNNVHGAVADPDGFDGLGEADSPP
jgi:hypothetical protein